MKKSEAIEFLKSKTRSLKDHPKPGIIFRDLTTVFQDGEAMAVALDLLAQELKTPDGKELAFDKFVGVEARGFLLAGALSGRRGGGVVLMRKPGKLPAETISVSYDLEYGSDALEVHKDAIRPGERVVVVDDLLATGGTAEAACKLVEQLGGVVVKVLFLVDLPELNGSDRLSSFDVSAVLSFSGH